MKFNTEAAIRHGLLVLAILLVVEMIGAAGWLDRSASASPVAQLPAQSQTQLTQSRP